ncbi:MAG: hypothetical protein H6922_02450 [Pseudomonadaceae bacterium]|nr:hypothetical protein [Pseudomonadaceae bacterium]
MKKFLLAFVLLLATDGALAHDGHDHGPFDEMNGECQVLAKCGDFSRVSCGKDPLYKGRWLYVDNESGDVKAVCPREGCVSNFKRGYCKRECEPLAAKCDAS